MCVVNEVCPVCGVKGKRAKPKWYQLANRYFKVLHRCTNRNCRNFGKTYTYEDFNYHFRPASGRYCFEHDKPGEIIEAHRKGLTVECKAQCPADKKTWSFEIRLYRGC